MTTALDQIMDAVRAALAGVPEVAAVVESPLYDLVDNSDLPAIAVWQGGHSVEDRASGVAQIRQILALELHVTGEDGPALRAARTRLYRAALKTLKTDAGLWALISDLREIGGEEPSAEMVAKKGGVSIWEVRVEIHYEVAEDDPGAPV